MLPLMLIGCASGTNRTNVAPTQVWVLGTLHRNHLDENFHYSLWDLDQAIRKIGPDIICGEVSPQARQGTMRGYFPPEQRIVEQIALGLKIPFAPADWRAPSEDYIKAEKIDPNI